MPNDTPNPNPAPAANPQSAPNPAPQNPASNPSSNPPSFAWPDNWRQEFTGGDAELLKRAERYADPKAVWNGLIAAQQKLSERPQVAPKPQPGADGKIDPEALKTWRQAQGLPLEPKEFKMPLPKGMKDEDIDEGARARIDTLNSAFFDADMTQAQVEKVVGKYNEIMEAQAEELAVADAKMHDTCEDTLRAEWGADYRNNIALTTKFMEQTFGNEADALFSARTADGRRLFNIPEVAKAFTAIARLSGIDGNESGEAQIGGGKSIDQRLQEINQILATNSREYYDKKLDVEKAELLKRKGV